MYRTFTPDGKAVAGAPSPCARLAPPGAKSPRPTPALPAITTASADPLMPLAERKGASCG